MKGVILAGGEGTRLRPLTLVTNKHLLPVYNKPVIYYAIEKFVEAGIDRIMIVTSPRQIEDFVNLLGSGQNFTSKKTGKQIQIVYGIQNRPSGIADGLYIAKDYVGQDDCVLYLGDNIFEDDLSAHIQNFEGGALVFLKEVKDPQRFGVATIDKDGRVVEIEEKPAAPKSNLAVTGVYVYDNTVFDKMVDQPTSERGEYEITYVNNKYVEAGTLRAVNLKKDWFDIGSVDALLEANNFMQKKTHTT
jgi:glucose-1-phosphate thymidylyltransferase